MCKILDEQEVKPHKVRYYLERRDPEFEREDGGSAVRLSPGENPEGGGGRVDRRSRATRWRSSPMTRSRVSRRSPRRRTCRPSLACMRPSHASMNISATARSACWPGSISLTGKVQLGQGSPSQPRIHRIPQAARRAYPAHTAIKLILDNHSAHISKETKAWLAEQPARRFEFTSRPSTAPGSI